MDWQAWQESYDDPDSPLSERRACVQRRVRERLDTGPARVLSLCAGDGADVSGVLRPGDTVTGWLVEPDYGGRWAVTVPSGPRVSCQP